MLEAFAMSDKGCVRSNNEDYCLIEPERGLYVLADGMGGAKAGEKASRLAVDTVVEIVHSAPQLDSQVLLTAVEEANKRVITAAQNDAELEGMGTTLVAALDLTLTHGTMPAAMKQIIVTAVTDDTNGNLSRVETGAWLILTSSYYNVWH